MTKKHYIRFAQILAKHLPYPNTMESDLLWDIISYLKEDNANFDEDRFIKAIAKEQESLDLKLT